MQVPGAGGHSNQPAVLVASEVVAMTCTVHLKHCQKHISPSAAYCKQWFKGSLGQERKKRKHECIAVASKLLMMSKHISDKLK